MTESDGVKKLSILGSTGSIGTQTLEVVAAAPESFRVVAIAAGRNIERLAEQVRRFRPQRVSVADASGAKELRERLGSELAAQFDLDIGAEGLELPGLSRTDSPARFAEACIQYLRADPDSNIRRGLSEAVADRHGAHVVARKLVDSWLEVHAAYSADTARI